VLTTTNVATVITAQVKGNGSGLESGGGSDGDEVADGDGVG